MTTTKPRRPPPPKAKPEIPFPSLCAIVRRVLTRLPEIDNIDLKETVKEWVSADGFQRPDSSMVYRAVDAIEHASPTLRRAPPIAMPQSPPQAERPDPTRLPRPWTTDRAGPQTMTRVGELRSPISTSATTSVNSKRG